MSTQDFKTTENDIIAELSRLFLQAKETDEFEYISTLINFSGIGDARALDHILESKDLIIEFSELVTKASSLHSALRLLLILYSHVFEMDELYNIIGNMIRVTKGERFAFKLYNSPRLTVDLKPANKIDKLKSLAIGTGYENLIENLASLYSSPLRNAIFHSSYSLSENDFYITSGKQFKFGNVITSHAEINSFVLPLTQSTVNVAGNFFNLFFQSRWNYKEDKIITGRLQPEGVKIEIIGDELHGLKGWKTIN